MDTRNGQYTDNLARKLDAIGIETPNDLARVVPLYIKVFNDRSVVNNVSIAYIDNYDGKTLYRKYGRFFNQLHEMFRRNKFSADDMHNVFRRLARRVPAIPTTVAQMKRLVEAVIEESHSWLKAKRGMDAKKALVGKFRTAIKKYLNLTYTLGYNEPSACARDLAHRHKIDKYVMSGDFPVLLLPFMPEVEDEIRRSYEHYEMKDAWEVLRGRYFNHRPDYANLAIEIKASFAKSVPNFSDYFDRLYTDTYYKMMLEGKRPQVKLEGLKEEGNA